MNYREKTPTRDGFARGLLEVASRNQYVVGIGADLTVSAGMHLFKEAFPNRFFSVGIAEQNAVGIAAGLALMGKIPVFSTYGVFSAFRCADQVRVSVCYNNLHVIICGAHAGISVGADGATHQALEDIAVMRALPNMTVISPCDATQTAVAIQKAIELVEGPVYFRYGRHPWPDFTTPDQDFEVGKGQILRTGKDVGIFATGHMVWNALQAASMLEKENIEATVINIHTIKPIDTDIILDVADYCGAIVSCEEHQKAGGLSSAIAEVIVQNKPVPMMFVGVNDIFGESGQPEQLMKKYGLDSHAIVKAVKEVLKRKYSHL